MDRAYQGAHRRPNGTSTAIPPPDRIRTRDWVMFGVMVVWVPTILVSLALVLFGDESAWPSPFIWGIPLATYVGLYGKPKPRRDE